MPPGANTPRRQAGRLHTRRPARRTPRALPPPCLPASSCTHTHTLPVERTLGTHVKRLEIHGLLPDGARALERRAKVVKVDRRHLGGRGGVGAGGECCWRAGSVSGSMDGWRRGRREAGGESETDGWVWVAGEEWWMAANGWRVLSLLRLSLVRVRTRKQPSPARASPPARGRRCPPQAHVCPRLPSFQRAPARLAECPPANIRCASSSAPPRLHLEAFTTPEPAWSSCQPVPPRHRACPSARLS